MKTADIRTLSAAVFCTFTESAMENTGSEFS